MSIEAQAGKLHEAVVIEGRLYFGFNLTRRFFQQAILEGAGQKAMAAIAQKPLLSKLRATWERNLAATQAYIQQEDLTLEQIAREILHVSTRQRAHQIISQTLIHLKAYAKPETQQLFPMDLPTNKQAGLEGRKRSSINKGGRSFKIAQMIGQNLGVKDIIDAVGSGKFKQAKGTLGKWGIKLPYHPNSNLAKHAEHEQLAARLIEGGVSKQILDDNLAKVSRRFISNYNGSAVWSVRGIARQAGLHLTIQKQDDQKVLSALETGGVTVVQIEQVTHNGPQRGSRRLLRIAACDRERAVEILKNTPALEELRQNPVSVPFGPKPENLPTTTQLLKKKDFGSLGVLMKELGLRIGKKNFRLLVGDIFDKTCPVPIFRYQAYWLYPLPDEDKLRSYLQKRIKQIC